MPFSPYFYCKMKFCIDFFDFICYNIDVGSEIKLGMTTYFSMK